MSFMNKQMPLKFSLNTKVTGRSRLSMKMNRRPLSFIQRWFMTFTDPGCVENHVKNLNVSRAMACPSILPVTFPSLSLSSSSFPPSGSYSSYSFLSTPQRISGRRTGRGGDEETISAHSSFASNQGRRADLKVNSLLCSLSALNSSPRGIRSWRQEGNGDHRSSSNIPSTPSPH